MKLFSYVLVALFAVSVSTKSFAAEGSSSGGLAAGFHGGLSLANVSQTNATYDGKAGVVFGAQLEWQLMDWLYLQPELAYASKGAKTQTVVTTLKLDYLDIPILLKGKFDAGGWWPYILMGPHIGFALSRKVDSTDVSASYKSMDFGLHFGAGAAVPVASSTSVFLEGRYVLGLANLNNTATSSTISAKNKAIYVLAGMMFTL